MTLPPLNTPIAHDGSPECPVHPETTVRCGGITWNAWDVFWPDVTTYTIIARAPADRIAELEAALSWYQDQFCEGICSELPDGYYDVDCSGCKARATLKGASQ